MSEMLVAQCPHCQTRFRLSHEHLQAAAGNVRCGACLKVFDASSQAPAAPKPIQPVTPPPAPKAPETPAPSPTGSDRQGTLLIHDDLELDELDLEALGLDESILEEINPAAKPEQPAKPAEQAASESAATTFPEPEPDLAPAPAKQQPTPATKQPEEKIQAPETPAAAADRQQQMEERDAQLNIDSVFEFTEDGVDDAAQDSEYEDLDLHDAFVAAPRARDFELSPAKPTVDPSDTADQLFGTPIPEPMRPLIAAGRDHGIYLRDKPKEAPNPPIRISHPEEAEPPRIEHSQPDRHEPLLGDHLQLPDLADESLVLDDRPLARPPQNRALWIGLSIVAALGLVAQALLYNFESLSYNDRSRPMIEKLCLLAGCELPARVDISLIRSSNLTVRPHAEFPNALAVDVILYNRADFAQPFPVIRMNFSDLGGRELAQRTFRPEEYLGGELAGASLMPSQVPVHVGLSLLDPGAEVASYSLDFLSP